MAHQKINGSCLCQTVKFEIEGTLEGFFLCHCKHCQKGSGSAHAANMFSSHAKLKWLSGENNVAIFNLAPTRHTKAFCKKCGSGMPYQLPPHNLLVVPAGSLDSEAQLRPNAHIFYASRAKWDNDLEKIKRLDKS